MSSRFHIYHPDRGVLFAILILLLIAIVSILLIGVSEVALQRLGFSRLRGALILVATFLGGSVNIPLWRVRPSKSAVETQRVPSFWATYQVPHVLAEEASTLVAINLGGAAIPSAVSLYLVGTHVWEIPQVLLAVIVTAIVVHLVARKVPGVGIAIPAFIPPLTAAFVAYVFAPSAPNIVAYVSGTLGTLIGGDLTNLRRIGELGTPIASIAGAGTFDGIFLSGVIAVLLA